MWPQLAKLMASMTAKAGQGASSQQSGMFASVSAALSGLLQKIGLQSQQQLPQAVPLSQTAAHMTALKQNFGSIMAGQTTAGQVIQNLPTAQQASQQGPQQQQNAAIGNVTASLLKFSGGLGSVASVVYRVEKAMYDFARGIAAANDHYRQFNAEYAVSGAKLEGTRLNNTFSTARDTAGSGAALNEAVARMETAWRPLGAAIDNATNIIATTAADLSTNFYKGWVVIQNGFNREAAKRQLDAQWKASQTAISGPLTDALQTWAGAARNRSLPPLP